ncbi:hypothetical protein [Methanolobus profundi]|nr:hypothetical protein [Methanolobus profundi]
MTRGIRSYLDVSLSIRVPDWKRALSAVPDFRQRVRNAALKDLELLKT